MFTVHFSAQNLKATVPPGATILEAARSIGVTIEAPCNAVGTCGKCRVKVPLDQLDRVNVHGSHRLSAEQQADGWVLACQASVRGDLTVQTLGNANQSLKIVKDGHSLETALDSWVTKVFEPRDATTRVWADGAPLGIEAGDTSRQRYGVVVDIGTTTLVVGLVDLASGEELGSASALNPQAVYGQDVLSRISFSSSQEGLNTLHGELVAVLNNLLAGLLERHRIHRHHVYEVIYSGNTCMLYLSAGVSPASIGTYPYLVDLPTHHHLAAGSHKLSISPFGQIYLPPVISAYVGADITSGILAASLHKLGGTTLFVDIGTNGEMVFAKDGKLSATSTAAGPAFEGMNITHGMRAGDGAIEYFEILPDGTTEIRVIGEVAATGICGSGLLDIVGELVKWKLVNKAGRFVSADSPGLAPALAARLSSQDGKPVFRITESVWISQKDIRQVQLAKGAVRAGIEYLLQSQSVAAEQVDRVLIAGSFGYHLRAQSLIHIGLLPPAFAGKVEFLGNTSKSGGRAFLVNQGHREEMHRVVKDVQVIELAHFKDFERTFVGCLEFSQAQ